MEGAPGVPEVWFHRGVALAGLGRTAEAKASLSRSAAMTLGSADAQNSIGFRFLEMKANVEAEACFRRAISLNPDYALPYVNLGRLLAEQQHYESAEKALRKAIDLAPDLPPAHVNLGGVLNNLRRADEAVICCLKSIALDPDCFEAHDNLGTAFSLLRRYRDAVACFEKCLELNPSADYIYGDFLHAKMMICDWSGHQEELMRLETALPKGEKLANPFVLLGKCADPALQRKAAELFTMDQYPEDVTLGPIAPRPAAERIRLGYFSADFRSHPLSYLMAEVFERHDRSRFELVAFSFGASSQDPVRQRIRNAFDDFIEVDGKSDVEVAALARDRQIDIAVDLGGHTEHARLGIFARRAAQVQVGYLGYLGTTGAPYIDYILADQELIGQDESYLYTEKVAYLSSYQANDSKRVISDRQFTRQELGLPETGFVFCCFNNSYKLNPQMFDVWARILERVPDSTLLLYVDNPAAMENLRVEAKSRGLTPGRIVMTCDRLPVPDYLARYRIADLFLDTLPYNAGTTASDALWAGLPVLTCKGKTFAGRMAASLLKSIDLPELVVANLQDYEELAVSLATRPDHMGQIRQKLQRNRLLAPLFDSERFTRDLESLYRVMHERNLAGLPPENIVARF